MSAQCAALDRRAAVENQRICFAARKPSFQQRPFLAWPGGQNLPLSLLGTTTTADVGFAS
jgi:hypothetical protein